MASNSLCKTNQILFCSLFFSNVFAYVVVRKRSKVVSKDSVLQPLRTSTTTTTSNDATTTRSSSSTEEDLIQVRSSSSVNLFCSTSLPVAIVLDGFDQRYQASAVHCSKQQRHWLTLATSRIHNKFLGMAGIKPGAAWCKARTLSIVLYGPHGLSVNLLLNWDDIALHRHLRSKFGKKWRLAWVKIELLLRKVWSGAIKRYP